eukprot:scaffold3290_cov259-Pinguiococcus_pyrenoidosus.AAC.13
MAGRRAALSTCRWISSSASRSLRVSISRRRQPDTPCRWSWRSRYPTRAFLVSGGCCAQPADSEDRQRSSPRYWIALGRQRPLCTRRCDAWDEARSARWRTWDGTLKSRRHSGAEPGTSA